MKKSNTNARTLGAVTHTHTGVYRKFKERRKLIYNFFLRWSKGGSREHYGIALLPRDYIG